MKLKIKDIFPIILCFLIGGLVLFGSVVLACMVTLDEPSYKSIAVLTVLIVAGARYVRNKIIGWVGEAWWDEGI